MSKLDRKRKRHITKAEHVAGLPELAPTPKKQPNGRTRRAESQKDPRREALEVRARGFSGDTSRKGLDAMSAQHMGSQMGLILQVVAPKQELPQLWQTFAGWSAAENTYRARYLGQLETPQGSAIAMVPDSMQADEGHTIDTRDPDQKDRDAVSSWMHWQGHLAHLDGQERAALQLARVEQDHAPLWKNREPTPRGLVAYRALKRLHKAATKAG